MNIAAVLIVAALGNEADGLLGFQVGDRRGRQLLEHPVAALKMRKKAVAKGEEVCKGRRSQERRTRRRAAEQGSDEGLA